MSNHPPSIERVGVPIGKKRHHPLQNIGGGKLAAVNWFRETKTRRLKRFNDYCHFVKGTVGASNENETDPVAELDGGHFL